VKMKRSNVSATGLTETQRSIPCLRHHRASRKEIRIEQGP
jgi:hypothetical protein